MKPEGGRHPSVPLCDGHPAATRVKAFCRSGNVRREAACLDALRDADSAAGLDRPTDANESAERF